MHLRIEEDLRMVDAIGMSYLEVTPSQCFVVRLRLQNRRANEIIVQKVLQACKMPVSLVKRRWRCEFWAFLWIWQFHPIASCQLERQLRCQAALEVNMMFTFGQILQEFV
jgi:hypothetical protein